MAVQGDDRRGQGYSGCTKKDVTRIRAPQVIEVTAGEVAAELKRRGISSDERVTLTIEPKRELLPGRRVSRAWVVAAGLTDTLSGEGF